MSTMSSPVSPASLLSSRELSEATDYLLKTRDGLVDAVDGFSDSQWAFKLSRSTRTTGPGSSAPPEGQASSFAEWRRAAEPCALSPDCWSIAEIVEHLAVLEDRVHAVVGRMPEAPAGEPDRVDSQVDEIILVQVPKRSTRIKAPEPVCPSARWRPEESLARFVASRRRTAELLVEAPCLRGHVLPHPVLGLWDGYQWILAVAAHSARHTAQILEIKADGGFPDSQGASSEPLH